MIEKRQALTNWRFKAADETEWLQAVVPGCVHTDLLRSGRIDAPFYGTNERGLQWIDKKDWEYETSFEIAEDMLRLPHIELVFDGLDTYADVSVNGKHVLSADNMFRVWKADVKQLLQAGINRLHIRFRSPIMEDLPKLEKLGYPLPATNDQSETGGLGDKKVSIFARKAPYHYGWDWGPRFVTSGIWREVRLEAWTGGRITDLFIRQDQISALEARVTAVIEIETDTVWSGTLQLRTEGFNWHKEVRLSAGVNTVELEAVIREPELWWSRGLGKQRLYTFTVSLHDGGREVASRSARTGLRSIRLVREKDAEGTSFYFELNGKPVFAKGANHIPNDSFVTEVTEERYRHEIASAVQSNMNMIRVWGGGIYEADRFYELCDEYGLLVWQDFMFACSMYPGDGAFLENIRIEAEQNVKRLRNHPSIALWCGNNEIDSAWAHYDENAGWGWKQQYTQEQREKLWADYEAIFHRILPLAVSTFDPLADYWPSSPMQDLTGDIHQHAHPETSTGDIHYWGVWHAVEPFENYKSKLGRFMSEYGFQSFPEERTVRSYAEEADMELESDVMVCHQRHNSGNRLIKEYMDMYLKNPKDFPSFLYMSQVLQGEAMKMAVEAHRRRKPYCMGTLYWQLNDCWPVASWASMDYYGRWKAAQYYIRSSMKDIAVSIDSEDSRVDLHVMTDLPEAFDGTLLINAYKFDGTVIRSLAVAAVLQPNSTAVVYSAPAVELYGEYDPAEVVLQATLTSGSEILDRKEHYFVPAKEIKLAKPAVQITELQGAEGIAYRLETDVLAKQVWLQAAQEGIFTDNFFDLVPGVPVTVQFLARDLDGKAFAPAAAESLKLHSMADFVSLA
ncbi:glycoside hydrolase family 2 protein [Paenibacillus sambharensis]|uniref:Beta-mannosidase n=1 Tax=Paenibacillus sambharensis TaxID=1803190 RepID=A0A2W1LJB1_9BACL|nr:glycoside hydrolase family 2 protein [Paenibacillus sambharensis]PZD95005.1 glycoside hydrolase family 2 protein [Paenibacillus sambharensis]